MDKLEQHYANSSASAKSREAVNSGVIGPCHKMMEAVSNLDRDIEAHRLVRDSIDLSDRLFRKPEVESALREDPASKILIEANIKYHEKKIAEVLSTLAQEMKSAKLTPTVLEKRRVALSDQMLDRAVDKVYQDHILKTVPASELADAKDSSYSKLKGISADRPQLKAALLVIDLIKDELAVIDKAVPEIYDTLMRKASEYVSHIRPVISQAQRGVVNVSNAFRQEAVLSSAGLNREYLGRMIEGISQADPRERVVTHFGVTLTNEDLASLRNSNKPTSQLVEYLVEHFRAVAESARDVPGRKSVLVLSQLPLLEILRGNSAGNSDINVERWKQQTAAFRGPGGSVFLRFAKVVAPIRVNPEHIVVVEIRPANSIVQTAGGRVARSGYPEIAIFDSNQKEHRHLHNSLFMIAKRFVYEELLDKSGLSQAECYQESIQYSMRREQCPQQLAERYLARDRDGDGLLYALKTLQTLASGQDAEHAFFSARDVEAFRLEVLALVFQQATAGP